MNTFPPALKVSITSTDFISKAIFFFLEIDDMHIYESLYLPSVPAHVYQKEFIIQSFLKVVLTPLRWIFFVFVPLSVLPCRAAHIVMERTEKKKTV